MAHDRKLVLGGVSLTMAKVKTFKPWLSSGEVRDDVERELIASNYLEGAPFSWIGLIIRYGLVDETSPHYSRIDKNDGELPLAIEVDTRRLVNAPQEQVTKIFREATLRALIHAGAKYNLNVSRLSELLSNTQTV